MVYPKHDSETFLNKFKLLIRILSQKQQYLFLSEAM